MCCVPSSKAYLYKKIFRSLMSLLKVYEFSKKNRNNKNSPVSKNTPFLQLRLLRALRYTFSLIFHNVFDPFQALKALFFRLL